MWKKYRWIFIIGAVLVLAIIGGVAENGNSNSTQNPAPASGTPAPTNITSTTPPADTAGVNTPDAVNGNPTPVMSPGPDWSSYQNVTFEGYRNDPQAYLGSQILVEGAFTNNFFPGSGSGNGTNFMPIEDYSEGEVVGQPGGFPNIEIQISSNSDYTLTVQSLSNALRALPLRIYGTGTQSMTIDMTNGTTLIIPAISATRIDRCVTQTYGAVSPSDSLPCTNWETIFPTNIPPSGNIDKSSLETQSTTPTITGTFSSVTGAIGVYIWRGLITLPSRLTDTSLIKQAIWNDGSDHGGGVMMSPMGATSGTYSDTIGTPLQEGGYTVGVYTYQTIYDSGGFEGYTTPVLLATGILNIIQ